MKLVANSIRLVLLVSAVCALSACAEREVVVVHHPVHHTVHTAPAEFGVVNQYDHR